MNSCPKAEQRERTMQSNVNLGNCDMNTNDLKNPSCWNDFKRSWENMQSLKYDFFKCFTYLQKGHRCKQAWKEVHATHSLYRGHFVRDKQFFLPVGSEGVAHQIPDKAKKFYAKLPILVLVLASWLGCLQRLPDQSVESPRYIDCQSYGCDGTYPTRSINPENVVTWPSRTFEPTVSWDPKRNKNIPIDMVTATRYSYLCKEKETSKVKLVLIIHLMCFPKYLVCFSRYHTAHCHSRN